MIYGVRVRCAEGYDTGLALDLQEMGLDRIKLHGRSVTAEYKTEHSMCRDCMLHGYVTPLEDGIRASARGGQVEDVEIKTAARYAAADAIVRLDPRYHVLKRRVARIMRAAKAEPAEKRD